MKPFHFTADIVFDAEDIDDAFARLAKHFIDRLRVNAEWNLQQVGKMSIHPVSDCETIE